jgi:hypothetical protein
LVSVTPRNANALSALNSDPGSFGSENTMVVLSGGSSFSGRRPMTMKRVMLSLKSWMDVASGVRPKISPARADAIAAVSVSLPSCTILALPAVSYVAMISTPVSVRRKRSHCASACGCE